MSFSSSWAVVAHNSLHYPFFFLACCLGSWPSTYFNKDSDDNKTIPLIWGRWIYNQSCWHNLGRNIRLTYGCEKGKVPRRRRRQVTKYIDAALCAQATCIQRVPLNVRNRLRAVLNSSVSFLWGCRELTLDCMQKKDKTKLALELFKCQLLCLK